MKCIALKAMLNKTWYNISNGAYNDEGGRLLSRNEHKLKDLWKNAQQCCCHTYYNEENNNYTFEIWVWFWKVIFPFYVYYSLLTETQFYRVSEQFVFPVYARRLLEIT